MFKKEKKTKTHTDDDSLYGLILTNYRFMTFSASVIVCYLMYRYICNYLEFDSEN